MKKLLVISLIIIILFGIGMGIISLEKDFSAEETDYVKPAIAIINTGHLLFYQLEQKPLYELALWHPPMYIYSLYLIAKFSTDEIALRSLNFIFSILTAVIIFLFCLRINRKNGKQIGLLASSMFLINYYVLSSSLLIDIDALSMFFVFSFFYFIFSYYRTQKITFGILASLSFLFSLANRYPIAIITFFSVGVYFFIKRETKKFIINYFFIGLIGGVIFFIIWMFYSTIIEPGTFFAFIQHNNELGAAQFSSISLYIASFFLNISQIIRLFTIPSLILFIGTFFYFIKRREEYIWILMIYCLSIFLFFIIVPRPAFGYPRYFLTMMPGFFILIAIFIYEKLIKEEIDSRKIIFACLIFSLSLFLLWIINPRATIYESNGLILATNLPDFLFHLLGIIPIFLALFFKKEERKLFLIIALIVSFLAYSFYFDIKYTLNDPKVIEAGLYLKENTNSSDIVICPKSVAYYYGGIFYANDYYKPSLNKLSKDFLLEYVIKSYNDPEMENQFFWGDDIYGGVYVANYTQPDEKLYSSKYIVTNYLSLDNMPEKIIDNYYIYRMK